MDLGLRHNKTNKTDTYHLALIQRIYHHPVSQKRIRLISNSMLSVPSMTS